MYPRTPVLGADRPPVGNERGPVPMVGGPSVGVPGDFRPDLSDVSEGGTRFSNMKEEGDFPRPCVSLFNIS